MSNKILFLTVGHNSSGKTTLAKKLSNDLGITYVDGDDYRKFLKESVLYFNDLDFSHPNPKAQIASELTFYHRNNVCQLLLENGQSVIHCSSLPKRSDRQNIIKNILGDSDNTKIVILYVHAEEETLLKRLSARDVSEPNNIGWEKHYTEIKRDIFEVPSKDECDELLIYHQNNYEFVRDKIKELLASNN